MLTSMKRTILTLLLTLAATWPVASASAQPLGQRDALIKHLKLVIPDEAGHVPPKTLSEFVGRYQKRAMDAGLDDINRQTAYVLVALYTSGNGIEHPEFKKAMQRPPASADAFSDVMIGLPQSVYDSGKPLWESEAAGR